MLQRAGNMRDCTCVRSSFYMQSERRLYVKASLFSPCLFFILIMSNEEEITPISTEKTVGADSSEHIFKHLEYYEKRQQEQLEKLPKHFCLFL